MCSACLAAAADGGRTWLDPDSNALVRFDRPTQWKRPLPIAVTLWCDLPGLTPPLERANGRVGDVHPHTNLALVPYGQHVACIWGRGETLVWSHFDGSTWSAPRLVVRRFGGPAAATTVGSRTIYVVFRGKVYRLAEDGKWLEDSPPEQGPARLVAAGSALLCVGRKATTDAKGQTTVVWVSRKAAGGSWSASEVIACERTGPGRSGRIEVIAPQFATGDFVPVAWGPHAGWVKIMLVPVKSRQGSWRGSQPRNNSG